MLRLVARSFAFGLAGMIVMPVVMFFVVLIAAYPRCGTPGDSGGCEMGAASIAIFSSLPGVAIALVQAYGRRAK